MLAKVVIPFLISAFLLAGCADPNKGPVAKFTVTYGEHRYAPVSVSFDGAASHDSDGKVTKYSWNFGDGTSSSSSEIPQTTHEFTSDGTFQVSLTVTDNKKKSSTTKQTVVIDNGFPDVIVSQTMSVPALVVPNTFTFDASATTTRFPGASITHFSFDLGDGIFVDSSEPIATKTFTTAGVYQVRVRAYDSTERMGEKVIQLSLGTGAPTASFTTQLDIDGFFAPATATFNAAASAPVFPGSTIARYIWNFGDGSAEVTTTDKIVTHSFAKAGTYPVSLTVQDSGDRSTTQVNNLILAEGNPVCHAAVTSALSEIVVNRAVTLDASGSSAVYPGATLAKFIWTINGESFTELTSTRSHQFTAAGDVVVSLQVIDSVGKSSQCSVVVTVTNGAPKANFSFNPLSNLNIPITISFNGAASTDPDETIAKYSWNFGDGSAVVETVTAQTSHIYRTVGTYNVVLKVTDNTGLSASRTIALTTLDPLPIDANETFTGTVDAKSTKTLPTLTTESGAISVQLKQLAISSAARSSRFGGGGIVRPSAIWTPTDDPSLLRSDLNYNILQLPLSGEAKQIPWAGTYWPVYKDSINDRWAGSTIAAPSEKYQQAFSKSGIPDLVSAAHGVDGQSDSVACTSNSQCASGSACSKRRGQTTGRCIPTWFGLCHAWAPAAIMEKEPERAVNFAGVDFKVNDIKALITYSYNEGLATKFLSLRCNIDESELTYDDYGNPTNPECKDTNAGSFHIVATNFLGIHKESFVEDRTFDDEVWNQPVRGYEILKQSEISSSAANQLLGVAGSTYNFNLQAQRFYHVKMRFSYISEPPQSVDGHLGDVINQYTHYDDYEYVLETDSVGTILGGEWIGGSKKSHPDFLWLPYQKENSEYSGILYSDVKYLLEKSLLNSNNAQEQQLAGSVQVSKSVSYGPYTLAAGGTLTITMSPSSGDADLYVKNGSAPTGSSYTCRPYLEGVAAETCTFTTPGQYYVLVYGYQTTNYQLSVSTTGEDALDSSSYDFSVAANEWKHFGPFTNVDETQKFLSLVKLSSGDVDLYVKSGSRPTASSFDCRPYYEGQQNESCVTSATGAVYVSILGYASSQGTLYVDFVRDGSQSLYLLVKKGGAPTSESYDCKQSLVNESDVVRCDLTGSGQLFMSLKNDKEQSFNYSVDVSYKKLPSL